MIKESKYPALVTGGAVKYDQKPDIPDKRRCGRVNTQTAGKPLPNAVFENGLSVFYRSIAG
jgi:hypothetical protein